MEEYGPQSEELLCYLDINENHCEFLQQFFQIIYPTTPFYLLALHIAASEGHIEFVDMLIEMTNPFIGTLKNDNEENPLHLATKNGRIDVVKSILKHDKSLISSEDENGNTPLVSHVTLNINTLSWCNFLF